METEKTNPTIEQLKKEMRIAELLNRVKKQEREIKQKLENESRN